MFLMGHMSSSFQNWLSFSWDSKITWFFRLALNFLRRCKKVYMERMISFQITKRLDFPSQYNNKNFRLSNFQTLLPPLKLSHVISKSKHPQAVLTFQLPESSNFFPSFHFTSNLSQPLVAGISCPVISSTLPHFS